MRQFHFDVCNKSVADELLGFFAQLCALRFVQFFAEAKGLAINGKEKMLLNTMLTQKSFSMAFSTMPFSSAMLVRIVKRSSFDSFVQGVIR